MFQCLNVLAKNVSTSHLTTPPQKDPYTRGRVHAHSGSQAPDPHHTCPAAGRTARRGAARQLCRLISSSSGSSELSPAGSALRSVLSLCDSVSHHEEPRQQDCATMPQDLTEEATQGCAENLQVCVDHYSTRTAAVCF